MTCSTSPCPSTQLVAGDTFNRIWTFYGTDSAGNQYVYDLAQCSVRYGIVSTAQYSTPILAVSGSVDVGAYIAIPSPSSSGQVSLSIPGSITESWAQGPYSSVCKVVFPNGTVMTEVTEGVSVVNDPTNTTFLPDPTLPADIGSMAFQNSNAVTISNGIISGVNLSNSSVVPTGASSFYLIKDVAATALGAQPAILANAGKVLTGPAIAGAVPGTLDIGGASGLIQADASGAISAQQIIATGGTNAQSIVQALSKGGEIFNLNPQNTQHIRRAIARVLTGTGRGTIACVGDSTTRGIGSGTGGTQYTNIRHNSWPYRLSQVLTASGIPAVCDNFFGGGDETIADLMLETTQISIGSDWSLGPIVGLGGPAFSVDSGATSISYTPSTAWDTAKIIYAGGTTGSLTLNPEAVTFNTANAVTGFYAFDFSQSLSSTVFSMQYNSGANSFISGFWFYNSAVPSLDVLNIGWGGSTSASWTANDFGIFPYAGLSSIAPDLTFIDLGINDRDAGIPLATYSANLQTLITAALETGDCVLIVPIPSDASIVPLSLQQEYNAAIYNLAVANNLPLIDLAYKNQSWEVQDPLGLYWDTLHHNALGYLGDAKTVLKFFQSI